MGPAAQPAPLFGLRKASRGYISTTGAAAFAAFGLLQPIQVQPSVPHCSPAWLWELCTHTSCPNSHIAGLQTQDTDLLSCFHYQLQLLEPSRVETLCDLHSEELWWGGLWQRFQASGQLGPRGRELFTGSQMLEMKRTCKNTSHSSIPPCNVGCFPRAYGLFSSHFKRSIITDKYVLSAPCMLRTVPATKGNKGALFLQKGLSHCEINLPL